MTTKRTAQAAPKPIQPPEINAKFKDRLPAIMNEICNQLLVIEPAISRVTIQLLEFLDYLDFEIKKLDLDVRQMKWETQVDLAKLKEAEVWLERMQQLRNDFNIDVMTSPPETIRAMVDRIQKLFGV
jgi:hypothetical protein